MQRLLFTFLAVVPLFLGASCNVAPSETQVRGDFARHKPACQIISMGVGDGEGSAVDYHIRYQCVDNVPHEDVFQYLYAYESDVWKLNARISLR